MNTELLQNLLQSDLVWQILIALAMLLLFRSVPKETLDKLEKRATETESTADDMAIKVLRWLNANKEILPTLIPETPAPTVPQPSVVIYDNPNPTSSNTDTTITVSQPPVGNTGSGNMDVSTPPFNPAIPITDTWIFSTTEKSFEHTFHDPETGKLVRRVIHVPLNTSPVFQNENGAGKQYPYPSVNVKPSEGVRFDIGWIAGTWGFSVLWTGVPNQRYEAILDYSAAVTGDKKDNLNSWLWHVLEVNGLTTGTPQGISNGARHTVKWGITGTGIPAMITPRICELWASAADNSFVSWHSLKIVPVEDGLLG